MARCMVSMLHMDQRCLRKPLQRKCVGLGATFLITTKPYCQLGIQIVFITVKENLDNIITKSTMIITDLQNKHVMLWTQELSNDLLLIGYEGIHLIVYKDTWISTINVCLSSFHFF